MTYLEHVKKRLQNHPVIAWVIVICAVITALGGLYSAVKPVIENIKGGKALSLSIVMEPHDPRFGDYDENGRRFNWGGGSQSLYLETKEPVDLPGIRYSKERRWSDFYENMPTFTWGLLSRLRESGQLVNIWEVMPAVGSDGMRIKVNVTYDADDNAPTILIQEWGIKAGKAPKPKEGIFLRYRVHGGAWVPPVGGQVMIAEQGSYPINLWIEEKNEDEEDYGIAKPTDYKQYLVPGEVAYLDINVLSNLTDNLTENPKPVSALHLRVYAKVLIRGVEKIVYSKNLVRAVILNGSNDWHEEDGDEIENSRHVAYFN